jgi:hypothetical protein
MLTSVSEEVTLLKTLVSQVPIYLVDDVVDMRCCVYGKLYRKNVIIRNRGKLSYKMEAAIPEELKGMCFSRAGAMLKHLDG